MPRTRLQQAGVDVPTAPRLSEAYRVTSFFFRDPAGYTLEIQRFERPDWPAPDQGGSQAP